MPRILSANLTYEKNRLDSDHPFVMLFSLDIQGSPGAFRLAAYDQDVTFHGQLYTRFPCSVDLLEDATSLALVHLRVIVSNVDQSFISLLENFWAPVADPEWIVTVFQCDATQVDETPFESGDVFSVLSVATDFLTATIDLVAEGVSLGTLLPKRRFTATSGFDSIPRRV